MTKLVFSFVIALTISSMAQAAPLLRVGFNVGAFRSKPLNSITKLSIAPLPTGELQVTIDPNVCSPRPNGPWICTKMAVRTYTVEVKIVRDSRPIDGPLVLGIGDQLHLEVGSGFTVDGNITYTGVFDPGTPQEERLELTPQIFTELMK